MQNGSLSVSKGSTSWVRRLLGRLFRLSLASPILLTALPQHPQFSLTGVEVVQGGAPGQIVISVTGGDISQGGGSATLSGSTGSTSGKEKPKPAGPGGAAGYGVTLLQPPHANPCVLLVPTVVNSSGGASLGAAADMLVQRYLINKYGICKAGSGTAVNVVTPSDVALSVWDQQIVRQLPSPAPTLPPGYGVVGIEGFLLSNDSNLARFSVPTVLGQMSISAVGSYMVSFDGGQAFEGPYQTPGASWPTGGIGHMFSQAGPHELIDQENWSGTWSLDGASGSLPQLETVGYLQNLNVYSLVALRTS